MTMFGAWLVQRKRATSSQILAALDAQERARPPLYEIAMSLKKLSAADALRILDENRRTGQCFGVLAVQLGLLTKEDVDAVRLEQSRHGPKLGEILVILGVLTTLELERELAEFRVVTSTPQPERRPTPPNAWSRRVG